ncbi:MAG: tRNA pseudouridine(38-40) synthase TruA [Candidatus Omnitrophota bacterium]
MDTNDFSNKAMRNILLKIEYDGTRYAGWQIQKNAKTIQAVLEAALERITGVKTRLVSCGRTDAGVHALGHMANFKTASEIPLFKLIGGLNGVLPEDITVKEIREVPLNFHSRFDAKSKIYRYTILNTPSPSAISRCYVYHIPYKLNLSLMKKEAKCLLGRHNFKSFQASDPKIKNSLNNFSESRGERSSVRAINRLDIKKRDGLIKIETEADGFLYNMMRNITGTLIEIGRGRLGEGSMRRILRAKDRRLAGPTAPARGLCLVEVKFSTPL